MDTLTTIVLALIVAAAAVTILSLIGQFFTHEEVARTAVKQIAPPPAAPAQTPEEVPTIASAVSKAEESQPQQIIVQYNQININAADSTKLNCPYCNGLIDISKDTSCPHCGAPIMINK